LLPATLPALDRIKLSREFYVTEWIEPAFCELYTSDWLKLKDADVKKIGLKFFATAVSWNTAYILYFIPFFLYFYLFY
jgi:hypothetical protein